ncbi:MAG TPA: hypothetical protein VFH73_28035 [Polyangia bacterium]|nr:hypothetical protein [Polyangia bacterium]
MTPAFFPLLFALALSADGEVPATAAARFDQARRLFDTGQYAEAARVFGELQVQTGDAALLYPTAQSLRLAGRCPDALAAYERFLGQADLLRERAETAAAGSGVKRLANDLIYAGARIVEMRTCVGYPKAQDARQAARPQAANGDTAAAIAKLSTVWIETKDATLLPEIADLHRVRGDCTQAGELLDLAVNTLAPIENLREVAAPGSHSARAADALRRARVARRELKCTPGASAPAEKQGPKLAVAELPQATQPLVTRPGESNVVGTEPDRAPAATASGNLRWPLWTAGVGAALLVGGGVSFILAHQKSNEFESYMGMKGAEVKANQVYEAGQRYDKIGIALVSTGAAVTAASLVYYFVVKDRDPGTGPGVKISGKDATFTWAARF